MDPHQALTGENHPELIRIAEHYQCLLGSIRSYLKEVNSRLCPLTEEMDILPDGTQRGGSAEMA